jgi:hypothetical protein
MSPNSMHSRQTSRRFVRDRNERNVVRRLEQALDVV